MFYDRADAARQLAEKLAFCKGQNPLVLAIPRGAVGMGRIIAQALGGELDVILVRKLRAPFQPELAVGAIDENGATIIDDYAEIVGADQRYLESEKRAQLDAIRSRRTQYTPVRAPIPIAGRTVIVVDDGLATGSTMMAALRSLKAQNPATLICAVPVSPPDTLQKIAPLADQVVCLEAPDNFHAVGQFYVKFPQVDDDEVMAALGGE
jgi:putative phosphoribosyl transferase